MTRTNREEYTIFFASSYGTRRPSPGNLGPLGMRMIETVLGLWYWLHRLLDGGWMSIKFRLLVVIIGIRYWLHRLFDDRGPSFGYTVSLTVLGGVLVTPSL